MTEVVSLAVQMLANPLMLFLNEATTGLDAATAFQLVNTIYNTPIQKRDMGSFSIASFS